MMRVSDHYAVIVVDGKPVKESNVRINFQPATNTFVATCEIPYTHGANFAIHYYYKHTDRCYTATAMVDGQFAASMIRDPALMPKDKPLKHEGFITTRGVRLFRWARMARREGT
ncbi:hypothetical protein IE81DRAFT_206705 [Ceraceosorus guamensis]|uniref:Uncharacterized protein n=1 Tax=Ceraceosorus guamensis TaxID=1522189 RepID=A0A316WCA1_9BASI|nr:hypothetical protein IE81DRAFT_206705 [Ceraceosorus guamensis]PWN45165.1 hypothetical protein IE81DRAFT_206705 [Ceraceosorus guamensis]